MFGFEVRGKVCPILPLTSEGMQEVRTIMRISGNTPIMTGDFIRRIQLGLGMAQTGEYNDEVCWRLGDFAKNIGLFESDLSNEGGYPVTTCALYKALGIECNYLEVSVVTPGAGKIQAAIDAGRLSNICEPLAVTPSVQENILMFGLPVAGILGLAFLRSKVQK